MRDRKEFLQTISNKELLDSAIAHYGSKAAVALAIGAERSNVSAWRKTGEIPNHFRWRLLDKMVCLRETEALYGPRQDLAKQIMDLPSEFVPDIVDAVMNLCTILRWGGPGLRMWVLNGLNVLGNLLSRKAK